MTEAPSIYRRLPYSGRTRAGILLTGKSTLWETDDHLLSLNRYGFVVPFWEEYRRFYFSEIRSLSIEPTPDRAMWNTCWIGGAALFLVLAVATMLHWHWQGGFFLLPALFFAVLALENTSRGPTCRTRLQTAVQTAEIPALGRQKMALRFREELASRLAAVQGSADPAQILDAMAEPPPRPAEAWTDGSSYRGGIHLLLFSLFLAGTLSDGLLFLVQGPAFTLLGQGGGIANSIVCIIALVRQAHRPFHAGMKRSAWFAFVMIGLSYLWSFVLGMRWAIQHPAPPAHPFNNIFLSSMLSMSHVSPLKDSFYFWSLIFDGSGMLVIGLFGLAATLAFRRRIP